MPRSAASRLILQIPDPPLEFEFKVLNANLMAPLPAVVIIVVVRSGFARAKISTIEESI
jgi:hypothetical protein